MNTKYTIVTILVILFFSCSEYKMDSEDVHPILLKKTGDIQPISSYISKVDYISLDSPEKDIVIGKIEELKILGNEIIIKHRFSMKTGLLRFSGDGTFLNEIGQNGRSPGEILNPRDIISFDSGYAIWDQSGIYSFSKTGDYKAKLFEDQMPGNRFFDTDNKFYIFHENTAPGYLSEYTSNGKKEQIFLPNNLSFACLDYSSVTEIAKDSFHLFSPINDTIYAFSRNRLFPKYVIKGKSHPTLIQLLKKAGSREPMELLRFINTNQHWIIGQFLENRNFIFITYQLGSNSFSLIIRKNNWETIYVKSFINDIDGGVWDDPIYLSENDELYIPLNSYQVTGHKIKNKKRHSFDEIQKNTEVNDNPVIMVCKLK